MAENEKEIKQLLFWIGEAEGRKRESIEDYKNLERELFETCTHPKEEILEGEFSGSVHVLPPFRVCKTCGYAEEGWDRGYLKLDYQDNEVSHISRQEAEKYVRRLFTQDELSVRRFNEK